MSLLLPIPWLTEERPDKHRRRRVCLGCGESFEYPINSVPAVSFVAWIKTHLPCGEFYSPSIEFYGAAAEEAAASVASLPKAGLPEAGLPECPQCGFVGVYLHPSGVCTDCEKAAIAAYCATLPQDPLEEEKPVKEENREEDPRIAVFMERTGCTREEVQSMIDQGLITLRGSEELVTGLRSAASMPGEAAFVTNERPAPKLAPPVPPLNPAGDPCTFTTKTGPLLRRGNVKQVRAKKKPELMLS